MKVKTDWAKAKEPDRSQRAEEARKTTERVFSDGTTSFATSDGPIAPNANRARYLDGTQPQSAMKDLRIFQRNDLGQPYNGMGQTGLARVLLQMSAQVGQPEGRPLDARFYRNAAEAVLRTVVAQAPKGGLSTIGPCRSDALRTCAWFHSVTRRDRPSDFGATLNQNLHVVRDFGLIKDTYVKFGWPEPYPFDRLIADSLNQLFIEAPRQASGDLPTLEDYLAPPAGLANVRWMYYGFNRYSPPGSGGYFLGRNGKDCGYQVHVLHLLSQILQRAKTKAIWPVDRALTCEGPLARAYRDTALRMTVEDPSAWSDGVIPKDGSCSAAHRETFRMIGSYYRVALVNCRQ